MKIARKLTLILLFLGLVMGLIWYSSEAATESLIDNFSHWLQFSSKHALTTESELQGKKPTV